MADRIGLTMRSASAESYGEERDAIARDWYSFLASAVPELEWVLLPSLGAESARYARRLGVDRLILSGGNDLGCAAVRSSAIRADPRESGARIRARPALRPAP